MWQRLDHSRIASALTEETTLAAACYPNPALDATRRQAIIFEPEIDFYGPQGLITLLHEADDDDEPTGPQTQSFPEWVALNRPRIRRWLLRPARMQPTVFALEQIPLPAWANSDQLAQDLGLSIAELNWLSQPAWHYAERPWASHYRHRLIAKTVTGMRLLEVPKQQLAATQRQIYDQLLRHIPVHEAAHGFIAGRSVLTHAALHAGQEMVYSFDLRDFFHSVSAAQICATWRNLGYPQGVAEHLTALTTVVTPKAVIERLQEATGLHRAQARRLAEAHLAQGAPSSPALSNLCAFRLDLRLVALAERFGARYSRYADDLVFSGPRTLQRDFAALRGWIRGIAADEGYTLHPDKTRRMSSHSRQKITGVVVNEKPNLSRKEYDLLRARLHQLSLQPSVSMEQRATLEGRVAWACQLVTPARQAKLRTLLERIPFADGASSQGICAVQGR